ncbi:cyclin [Aspergillus sclerotiicarbonarius CBS 121057]|uniref:Cyclin n=1 Tax=Aspergillus sclerotiicarbonarius (strain CBS 121057 / IBT 28362) TaxID=1448318 RepID=A0A319ETV5_ASPSB|nr:cyclin [Aspergillus sclerotiicarbonarius CBS 121057]
MDFYLRCNSLKCRTQLKERAVVTTCSHIFCLHCAGNLGLSHPTENERTCPACQTVLVNPDDAVATVLNPTEDYKTSVLSGLDPNTIMECAGRALLFWTYQTTQEIFYQEFLAKTLTDKYTNLNTQLDKVIHNANSEISALQARVSDMQTTQEQLRKKNQELVDMYREKCKKFTQMTNLYNLLKSRAMRSQMQTAATDTVSQALNSLTASRNDPSGLASIPPEASGPPQTPLSRQPNVYPVNQEGVEQLHRHQRSGTGSSKGAKQKADNSAMPPPSRPMENPRKSNHPAATPQHRTRLMGPSRPSTAKPQLPHDSIMLERFQGESGPIDSLITAQDSLSRRDIGMQPRGQTRDPTEPPGMRSFFDSTII